MNIKSLQTYGFTIDPSLPCWEWLADTILRMPPKQWFTRLDQMAYHNLCSKTKLPPGTQFLLGLSEKILYRTRPTPRNWWPFHIKLRTTLPIDLTMRLLPTPETNWGWLHPRALYSLTMGTSWNPTWRHGTMHAELFHQTGTALPTHLSTLPPSIQPLPIPIQSPSILKGEQRDHCMSNRQEPWSSHHGPCRLHQMSTQRPSQIKHRHSSELSRSPQSNARHWTQINKSTWVIWWYTI
jgi:hypothetical protein